MISCYATNTVDAKKTLGRNLLCCATGLSLPSVVRTTIITLYAVYQAGASSVYRGKYGVFTFFFAWGRLHGWSCVVSSYFIGVY